MLKARHAAPVLTLGIVALGVGPAIAAGGGSGLSISPAIIEHVAATGKVGSVTIGNRSGQAIKISVTAHPWLQSLGGSAVPNQRATLAGVRPSVGAFTLANGASRVVSISLLRVPSSGSLYGNIEVNGLPTKPGHGPNPVTLEYRLVGSLRIDPRQSTFRARAGGAVVTGSTRKGELALAVTNTGNSIAPIGGSADIAGPRGGGSRAIAAVRILPGATVDVPVLALDGSLPGGSYTLSATLTESGHRVLKVSRRFKLR